MSISQQGGENILPSPPPIPLRLKFSNTNENPWAPSREIRVIVENVEYSETAWEIF
jgi:hypothetical protein